MLGRHTCERCRNRSLDQGRVTFVGVARSEKPFPPRSMLLIEFECSRCHTVYRIHEDRPIEHIIEAVESFGRYDEDFVLPGPDGEVPDDVEAEQIMHQNETEQQDNSATAITDEEVNRFLKRLKRTSFKCQSKSLRAWLSRLGIDPDQSADDLLDEPPSEPPF